MPARKRLLKIPLQRAMAELEERVRAGRELAQSDVAGLEPRTGQLVVVSPRLSGSSATQARQGLADLYNHVGLWRDYNQARLSDPNVSVDAGEV